MITIAGVVFSMTLVALSLASSQLGPRLLRNFMRDTATQVVLGTFVATFLYCLLVLRTIRRAEETLFVPRLSVTLGVLLVVLSVGVLIYFIHHVSISIQANEIVARVGKKLIERIERLFPKNIGRGAPLIPTAPPDADVLDRFDQEAGPIESTGDGYLQFIDGDALMELAIQEDVVIRVKQRPGHYVVATRPLAMVWPGNRVTDQLKDQVNSAFALGNQRTSRQDYGRSSAAVTIRLLETIAVVAGSVHRSEDRIALLRQARMIARGASGGLPEDEDRQEVEQCFQSASQALELREPHC